MFIAIGIILGVFIFWDWNAIRNKPVTEFRSNKSNQCQSG